MAPYLLPRPFPYNAARFRLAFRLHLLAIIGLALVAILILRLSPRLMLVAYLLLAAMMIVIALTLLNALWPVQTTHSVDGESVILRQGLGFKLVIPLAKISKAKRLEAGAGRHGIKLDRGSGVLEVIAHGPEAVRLRLNDPVVYKGALVRDILVDVLEPREFIECIRERKKGAALMARMESGAGKAGPSEAEVPILKDMPAPSGEEADGEDDMGAGPEPEAVKAERMRTWNEMKGQLLVRPPASPPPEQAAKAPAGPARPEEPRMPKAPPAGPKTVAKALDEDEIELVPALPSSGSAGARVVKLPKRKN